MKLLYFFKREKSMEYLNENLDKQQKKTIELIEVKNNSYFIDNKKTSMIANIDRIPLSKRRELKHLENVKKDSFSKSAPEWNKSIELKYKAITTIRPIGCDIYTY